MQLTAPKPYSYESFPPTGLVAYFSMEIAINPRMPTYSGGLGVLAGDTLRSAADLGVPLVAFHALASQGILPAASGQQGACRPKTFSRGIPPTSAPRSRRALPSPSKTAS